MDPIQISLWVSLVVAVVGSILGLLYLTGVLFKGASPSSTPTTSVTSRVCTKISDYVETSTTAPQNVDSLSRFGLVVGGSSAGSIVAVYNKEAALESKPDYLFFGRNTDGNYVEYSDAVLTWDLGSASGTSGSPKFASDPRYVAFHVNTTANAQLQLALVQPVYSVSLQRIDLTGERILDVQWIGTRLEFIVHVESVLTGVHAIRHYTQEVIHHWVATEESPLATSSDGLLFSCSADNQVMVYDSTTGLVEQYDVDDTTTWTKNEAVGVLDFGTALEELDVAIDATWVVGRSSSGIRASTRTASTEVWSVPAVHTLADQTTLFEFTSDTPGPMRFYLNERLYVLDGTTMLLFDKQGVQVDQVTLMNTVSLTEFHVDQLAVNDAVGLLFPNETGSAPSSFRATCT